MADPARRGLRAHPTVRLLSGGAFARYSAANFLSLVGSWGQRVAAGWLVWDWTGSAFWLGVLAMADLVPVVVIGPFAGVLADRWSRLRVNRVFQSALAALAAGMAALIYTEVITLWLLVALTAVNGVLTALTQPARLALVQELVPREDVPPAVAINAVKSNLARLVGPAVAAIMIVHLHISWVFLGNALVTALFVGVLGRLVLIPSLRRRPTGGVLAQIAEGFRFLLNEPALRLVLAMMLAGGVLVRGLGELLPAFAARSFADTVTGLALLTSSLAFGAVLAGLTLSRPASDRVMLRRATSAWAWGAAFGCAFGWAETPWLAMACICGAGVFMARGLILSQTFLQLRTPDEMRGRALSVHGLIARSSPALGALGIGLAIDTFGLGPSVTGASVLCVAIFASCLPGVLRQRDG